jgi:4a-hydroxytetrahydrobiopterin dehydratase
MIETPPGWANDGAALERVFDCGTFDRSIAFVNAVAAIANRLDHHPDLYVSWNEVTVRTWSHDVDAITRRDVELAREIDALRRA